MQSKILRLKILTVSLKLKFKCRLKVEYGNGVSTQEVTTSNGLFEVGQELQLVPKKTEIQLSLTLISQKGSSYNGGIVRTSLEQLRYSIGTAIKLSISKCIDKQAWIEVKVISVPDFEDKENKKDLSFTDQRDDGLFTRQIQYTPDRVKKGNLVLEPNLGETRSEHGFPLPTSTFKLADERKKIFETARPNFGQFSNVRMHKNRESRKISPFQSSPRRESPQELHRMQEQSRSRLQAQHSASKLKRMHEKCKQQQERVRQQQQKRKKIEFSEHSYKIELAKVNISKEEKQKQLAKKESRIKELEFECNKGRQNIKKMGQLKEQLKVKEAQTKHLQQQLEAQKKRTLQLKNIAEEQAKRTIEEADKTKRYYDRILKEKDEAFDQLAKKLKAKEEQISTYLNRISGLQESNERDKKVKQGVDTKSNQVKIQLQKMIAILKKDLKQSKDEYSTLSTKVEQQKSILNRELMTMKDQCEKLRMISSRATIEKRTLQEKIDDNEQKIIEMKRYRDKYTEQSNRYKTAKDQLAKIKRKNESLVEQSHKIEERLSLALKDQQELRKQAHSKDLKNIQLQERLRNLEETASEAKILLEKQRKSEQLLQKECSQMRQKDKQLKSQLAKKEIELAKLKLELDNANEKIMQMKSVKQQQKSQPAVHQQQWENSKANSLIQVQRFLELQLMNSKQTIVDLENSNVRIKQELQKWNRAQYQWRENERIWEAQKLRLSSQLAKSTKEVKDLAKRLAQEDARSMILNEKIQKERKTGKGWQEKYLATEAILKKTNDSKQEASSDLEIKEAKVRMLENQLIFIRGELEQREAETKRYKSVHDTIEAENKKMREQISDLTFRIKEEEQLSISENKKSRQEMGKYEARMTNLKRQFQKFKENLRNILVQSIMSHLSKDQQEKEITLRRREAKLGLTLTNELLIKLEEYLRELSRHKSETEAKLRVTEKDLITSRQEIILKTNQYQNTEGQLKLKLDELIDNLDKMKNIYSQREEQLRKAISDAQWQLSLKDNQIQKLTASLKETIEAYQRDSLISNENFSRSEKALGGQIEKLRARLNDYAERQAAYSSQITSLEEYINALQNNFTNADSKISSLEQQLERKQKEAAESAAQVQTLTQAVADLSRHKSQLKNSILSCESELQECKLLINQYKAEITGLQKEKGEESILIRNLMKEKEAFLHQYLASEEKVFHFETKQFALQESISALQEQKEKDGRALEELRRKAAQEAKVYEANLMKKQAERQSEVRKMEEKLKEKEKAATSLRQQVSDNQELLSQAKLRLQAAVKNFQSREAEQQQAIIRLESQCRELVSQNEALSRKNSEYEGQVRKLRESIAQITLSLEEANKSLAQSISANDKIEVELFSAKSQVAQLRDDFIRTKKELEEKDLQNYQLSSNFFRSEAELGERIEYLLQKSAMQEESMVRYQEICEDYAAEIEALKKSNETLSSINRESEAELARMAGKVRAAGEQAEASYAAIRQLQEQVRRGAWQRRE